MYRKVIAQRLVDIADELDSLGLVEEANEVDSIVVAMMGGGMQRAAQVRRPSPLLQQYQENARQPVRGYGISNPDENVGSRAWSWGERQLAGAGEGIGRAGEAVDRGVGAIGGALEQGAASAGEALDRAGRGIERGIGAAGQAVGDAARAVGRYGTEIGQGAEAAGEYVGQAGRNLLKPWARGNVADSRALQDQWMRQFQALPPGPAKEALRQQIIQERDRIRKYREGYGIPEGSGEPTRYY